MGEKVKLETWLLFKSKIKSSQIQAIFPEYKFCMKRNMNNVPIVAPHENISQMFNLSDPADWDVSVIKIQ